MKNKLSIILLVVGGLVLRLSGLINIHLAATGDFRRDWKIVGELVNHGTIPLLGPPGSVNPNFHLGPFYYYLLALPRLVSADFRVAIIFFSVLNTISIYVLYIACKKWFSNGDSLKISALYAFSCFFIITGSFPSNAYVVPPLIVVGLYLLAKIQSGKLAFLPLLFLVFGLLLQAHATTLFILPVFLFQLPLKKISIKNFALSVVIFFLSMSPWFSVNLKCNFCEFKEGISIFGRGDSNEICDFGKWLINHGHGESCFAAFRNTLFVFRMFTNSLFATTAFPVVIASIIFTVIILWKTKFKYRMFLISWLTIPTFLFLFYNSNVFVHYFLIYFPLPFFIFVLFLEIIRKKGGMGELIADVIFYLVIIWNIVQYLLSLRVLRG